MKKRWLITALFALIAAGGCAGLFGETSGDVKQVKVGWDAQQVVNAIGKPTYVIPIRVSWNEWVYPNGSVFLYRFQVQKVLVRPAGAPMPKPKRDSLEDVYQEKNIFE